MPFNLPEALELILSVNLFGEQELHTINSMLHNIENRETIAYMHEKIYWEFLDHLLKI